MFSHLAPIWHRLLGIILLIMLSLTLILLPGGYSRGQEITQTPTEILTDVPPPSELSTATITPSPSVTETLTSVPTPLPTVTDTLVPTETASPSPTLTETPSATPTESPTVPLTGPVMILNETAEVETGLWAYNATWNRTEEPLAHSGNGIFSDSPGSSYSANSLSILALVQPLSLPANMQIQLQYWQILDLGMGDSAQVQVSTDNINWTPVASDIAVRNMAWTVRTVNLNSYAGTSLWLRFMLSTDADPLTVGDGWRLDDLIVQTVPLLIQPRYGLTATESDDPTLWLTEGFWGSISAPAHSGSLAWTATSQSETAVALTLNTDISLSAFVSPELRFWHLIDLAAGGDLAQVQLSTDSGQNWFPLVSYDEVSRTTSWSEQIISLAGYTNQMVRIRFLLVTNGDGLVGSGWTVDTISLQEASSILATQTPTLTPTTLPSPTPTPDMASWTTFEDANPMLFYENGDWQTFAVTGAVGGTLTGTADPGATLTVYFEGVSARVIFSGGPEGRTFSAQIDDGPVQTADSFSETYNYSHVLEFNGLPDHGHILTVTNGEGAVWIEAIQVQGNLIEPPPILTSPLPPTEAGTIEPSLFTALSSSVVEDYEVFEAATTIDLIDIVMNEVNTHPDQPYLIHLTSPAYTITQAHSIGNIGETGMPVLGTLIIVGDNGLDENGNSLTPDQITAWNVIERSSAAPNIDLFHIAEGGSLTLYNIRLVNGGGSARFSGGAIVNDGELYLYNSQVVTNNSNYYGGGIHNAGTLVAINTEFTSNAAVDTVNLSGGAGSAIVNYGSLSAYCSTFKNNRVNPTITGGSSYVPFTIPGGAIYNQSSNINVHYSNFIGNTADGQNPNCPRWPQYGFCPLHIRDFASTVAVDASNNYWSQLDTTATWGSVTTSPTVPEVHYGDYSGEGDVCFVPPPPTAPLEITMSADDTTPRLDATVEFTITVSNPGQSELENVAVENEIPSELVYVQDDGEDATTYDADTNMIEWVFNLPAGESSELHIQMTLATATQSLQPTINMASPSIAALSVVVPENIDLAGSIITNTSTVKTIGGHDIDRLEAKLEIIPVACEGSIGSLITSAEMHSAPSIDPATLIATLEAPEEIGIIGYTLAPTGAPNCAGTPHCRWYRVARDAEAVEEGQERVGWIPADFIDLSSSCTDKVFPFDHESRIALLPTSSPECLAFITDVSRDNHGKIYTIEQIRDITNTDAAYDTYTLPAYSPVVITAIHPNRRYVRVVYRNVNGDPVRGDSWVEVREKDDDSYQDLTIISLGAGDTCVDEEGDFARDSIEALVVDPDNPDNGPNISLPSCDSTYLVNCVPDTTCHHIFGCDTTDHPRNTALVLNAFQDESDGGRGPTYCPLWDGVSGAENFHCGIDLVTEAYAVRNHTNEIGTEVFTVHGGLIYQYYSSTGSYKIRDREHYQQYIREYQYTHLDLRSELGNGTFANFVGEYLAAGIQIGTYSATTGTGSADIHVHYVEKVFLAPDHTWQTIDLEDSEDVILLDDDALQPLADNISPETYNPTYSAYQVPANFAAGTDNNPPARYIPLCKPNETENGGIVTRRIDNSGILTGVWRIEEGNISCQVARASRKCGRNDQIVFTLKETDTYDYPQGVFISENITSDQNRLDGTIENDLDNPVPHLFSIRIEAVDQACVPQRDGAIEFNWQIVP